MTQNISDISETAFFNLWNSNSITTLAISTDGTFSPLHTSGCFTPLSNFKQSQANRSSCDVISYRHFKFNRLDVKVFAFLQLGSALLSMREGHKWKEICFLAKRPMSENWFRIQHIRSYKSIFINEPVSSSLKVSIERYHLQYMTRSIITKWQVRYNWHIRMFVDTISISER